MQKPHDNSKASPAAFMQDNTLIAVIELGLSNWLVAGLIPGVSREPLKKLEPNPEDLLKLLHGWRDEAIKAGRPITRIAVAYETGRDSFWLARWLRERGMMRMSSTPPAWPYPANIGELKRIGSIRRC
jgi:hypothetical protein